MFNAISNTAQDRSIAHIFSLTRSAKCLMSCRAWNLTSVVQRTGLVGELESMASVVCSETLNSYYVADNMTGSSMSYLDRFMFKKTPQGNKWKMIGHKDRVFNVEQGVWIT